MYYSVVLQREILTRKMSLFGGVWFFLNFLNFASLLSLWREMGLWRRSTRTPLSSSKIHPFVSIALFFWAFSFCFCISPHEKEKEYIKRDLVLSLRERDKNALLLFDEMMRTTTTEKASLCVSCFSSLQRKKKTKKEVRLSVSLRSYTVSCNVILLSRFLSLSFSVSLSLERWN